MRELWKDETGLSIVEYALLIALIVVAGIAAWQSHIIKDTVAPPAP